MHCVFRILIRHKIALFSCAKISMCLLLVEAFDVAVEEQLWFSEWSTWRTFHWREIAGGETHIARYSIYSDGSLWSCTGTGVNEHWCISQNLCSSSGELLSDGNIADGKTLSQFLDAMENSMRLIGPQLREHVTRMETHNTGEKPCLDKISLWYWMKILKIGHFYYIFMMLLSVAEVAVTRNQTPPSGRFTLSTDSALFSTSWETVVGDSYPGTNTHIHIYMYLWNHQHFEEM